MLKHFFVALILCGGILTSGQIASSATVDTEVFYSEKFNFQPLYDKPWEHRFWQAYWGIVVNCNEWITLRAKPYTSAATVTRIPLGARVMIYDGAPYNGFYAAKYNGMYGYVLAHYIRSTNEAA